MIATRIVKEPFVLQSLFLPVLWLPDSELQRIGWTRVNAHATCEAIGSQLITVHDRFDRWAWRNPDTFIAVIASVPENAHTEDAYVLKQP